MANENINFILTLLPFSRENLHIAIQCLPTSQARAFHGHFSISCNFSKIPISCPLPCFLFLLVSVSPYSLLYHILTSLLSPTTFLSQSHSHVHVLASAWNVCVAGAAPLPSLLGSPVYPSYSVKVRRSFLLVSQDFILAYIHSFRKTLTQCLWWA